MSKLVDRIDATREAVEARAKGVAASDPLAGKLHGLADKLADVKKLIVATTEGGAITGEQRIREHLDELYGALAGWEGRPARYQLDRITVLQRELADATRSFDTLVAKDVRALDGELQQHTLQPIPALSELEHQGGPDGLALQCLATLGTDCAGEDRAATERD